MSTPSERLAEAREKRSLIAKSLHDLENGQLALRNVLGDSEHVLGRCRLDIVLEHCPGFGKAGVKRFFRKMPMKFGIYHDSEVGSLTKADVEVILQRLPVRVREKQDL